MKKRFLLIEKSGWASWTMENIWTEQLALVENKRIGKCQKVEFIMANISWLWIVLVNVERIYWRAYEKEETNEHLNRRSSNSLI